MNNTQLNKFFPYYAGKIKKVFWQNPYRLYAIRGTLSMGLLSVPFIIAGKPFFGVTLALGALAGALSETDDHPQGRLKALIITVLSFFVSSFSVGLLYQKPWMLGAGFILSTLLFVLIGGLGDRYRAISFGSIIVGIYAMLGIKISPAWYWQAVLLPGGALFHGIMSLILVYHKPMRLLDEQIAEGFRALSVYLEKKSKLFPSTKEEQAYLNNDLALLNISVVNILEKIKGVLNNYGKEITNQEILRPYLQRFMLLQSLHERASSSHGRHDKLGDDFLSLEIVEGLGEMLRQLAYSTNQVAQCLLNDEKYRHPASLEWISGAVEQKLQHLDSKYVQSLVLLHHNLHRSHISLKFLDNSENGTSIPRLRKDERTAWERFKAQLDLRHSRTRYSIRLSISFLLGFIIAQVFNLDKGAWIMLTSLFVTQITYIETRRRFFQRLMGTVTGIILGVLLLHIFTQEGQVILMLFSAFAFFYWVRTQYSIAVIFITIFVISAFNIISNDGGFHIMIPRLMDTLIGAFLSFLVIRFLWPGWQYRLMPALIKNALVKDVAYLQAIKSEYRNDSTDDLNYRIARREAHLADNELAQSWNSMRLEPKSKRELMQHAFTLTYQNHVLLSYISALAIHREDITANSEEFESRIKSLVEIIEVASSFPESDLSALNMDLSPFLLDLKQQINDSGFSNQNQQLRLFYNIAGISAKILKELVIIKNEIHPS
jgi:uncharacterized membrane protein (TIGR01666 family)